MAITDEGLDPIPRRLSEQAAISEASQLPEWTDPWPNVMPRAETTNETQRRLIGYALGEDLYPAVSQLEPVGLLHLAKRVASIYDELEIGLNKRVQREAAGCLVLFASGYSLDQLARKTNIPVPLLQRKLTNVVELAKPMIDSDTAGYLVLEASAATLNPETKIIDEAKTRTKQRVAGGAGQAAAKAASTETETAEKPAEKPEDAETDNTSQTVRQAAETTDTSSSGDTEKSRRQRSPNRTSQRGRGYQFNSSGGRKVNSSSRRENPDDDLVRIYLSDIGKHPLLTKDDEVRLGKQYQDGEAAKQELANAEAAGRHLSVEKKRELRRLIQDGENAEKTYVLSNLRLVVSIAKKYQASGLPLLDLVQEGNLGLMHAVGKFDYRKGFKFSTYATWWIRQAITRGIANTGKSIRLPVHAGEKLIRLHNETAKLEKKLHRPPTIEELAAKLEWTEQEVIAVQSTPRVTDSLSRPLGHDGDAVVEDVTPDHSAADPSEEGTTGMLTQEVEGLLSGLEPREREVLRLRFGLDGGEPKTLEEVGVVFGVTRERIRQVEAKSLAKLRHPVFAGKYSEITEFMR